MNNLTLNLNKDTEHKLVKVLAMYLDKDAFFRDVISYQIKRMQNEQINIQADLYDYEKKFGISTKDFYNQYKAGEKGDNEDTLIWAGIYEMFLDNMQKLSEIQ